MPSAYLQWRFHSGERVVARGPLVFFSSLSPSFISSTISSGVAKVSCILRHRGVQLRLAYSWARPAILVASKSRGGMFLFISSVSSLSFLFFLSSLSLSFISSTISSIFSLSLGDDTKRPTRVDVSLSPNSINQLSSMSMIRPCRASQFYPHTFSKRITSTCAKVLFIFWPVRFYLDWLPSNWYINQHKKYLHFTKIQSFGMSFSLIWLISFWVSAR